MNQTDKKKDGQEQNHIYNKKDLVNRFDACLGKTFEEIDDQNMFSQVQKFKFQKGIAGAVVEQCILGYPPNSKQEADLIVLDGKEELKTELKVTGMLIEKKPEKHFAAKEPMSITAVGIYDIVDEDFGTSHFWEKLEHMLIVYYYYASECTVSAYEYRLFQIKGYEFHEFTDEEIEVLRRDWEYVRDLCKQVMLEQTGPKTDEWKAVVKQNYINVHGQLKRVLSYINLAPKFPPRFRLKKPVVSNMISKHFGYELEQLPGKYTEISDVDRKCKEITQRYSGKTIEQIARTFNIPFLSETGVDRKGIAEEIVVAMFGGKSKKINQVELFEKFGLIAKTIVLTSKGGRTEDMKLFRIDFDEITRTEIVDDDGNERIYSFEDSEMYSYFADHEFLCIIFEEPEASSIMHTKQHSLFENKFIGFKRLIFDDVFIDTTVKHLWEDIRYKVMQNKLEDIVEKKKDGTDRMNANGERSSAPNFLKSSQNDVFVRGSGKNSSMRHKTECVNGIKMLPQYVWIKGTAIVEQLNSTPEI